MWYFCSLQFFNVKENLTPGLGCYRPSTNRMFVGLTHHHRASTTPVIKHVLAIQVPSQVKEQLSILSLKLYLPRVPWSRRYSVFGAQIISESVSNMSFVMSVPFLVDRSCF